MSKIITPPSEFIAAVAFGLLVGTIIATIATESLVVLVGGLALSMFSARAMIGVD